MKPIAKILLCCGLVALFAATSVAEDWTRFRGTAGAGVSDSAAPIKWDANTNIKWKTELPGSGSSCPIVLKDRVYLTCYTGYGEDPKNPGEVKNLKRHILAFDRSNGKEVWRTTIDSENDEDPFKGFITHHGYASSTPVTDGKHIFVHFGKTGLFAFDMNGKEVWKKHVGKKSDPMKWGNGASAVIYKDTVILNAGNTGNSIVAFNKSDGSEVWKVEDEKFTNTWTTPIVVKVKDRDELIINMPGKILSYDPNTGKELWWAKSPIERTVCGSCVYHDGVVYAMGGREGRAIAVKSGGEGDVSETHTVWTAPLRSGINTPIIADGNLVWIAQGQVHCASCKTGEYVFRERLPAKNNNGPARRGPSGDYASPIAIGSKILLTTKTGTTHVIESGNELKMVNENSIEGDTGRFNATPAVSDGQIFIRSDNKLYCISKEG